MKIGIMTFWESSDNYGQQLQVWALQQFLLKEGHSPYLIRFKRWHPTISFSIKDYLRYQAKNIVNFLINIFDILSGRDRKFDSFRKNNIVSSKGIYNDYFQLCAHPPVADAYITGSDQVWNYEMRKEELKAFYLQFGPQKTKRLSYAPSIGYTTISNEVKPLMKEYLSSFDAISVRESKSVELIADLGYNAKHVLDPTLLLKRSDYESLFSSSKRDKRYIFIYSLNYYSQQDLPLDSIINYSKQNNCNVIVTKSRGVIKPTDFYHDVEYDYPTIGKWLSDIYNAEIVVTASFHGIVFAILFHKRFLFTPLQGWFAQSNIRALSIITLLGLDSQVWDGKKGIEEYLNAEIDWKAVDAKLDKSRKVSSSFLQENLVS